MARKRKRTFAQYLERKRKKRNTKGFLKIIKESNKMSKRYSGKSFKDSSVMKKAKLSIKEKRRLKKEKKKNK